MSVYEKNMQCDHSRGCSKIKIQPYFGKKKKKNVLPLCATTHVLRGSRGVREQAFAPSQLNLMHMLDSAGDFVMTS